LPSHPVIVEIVGSSELSLEVFSLIVQKCIHMIYM